MLKKILLATLAVFVLWSLLDMILHYVLLAPMYEETSRLWRPTEEMKMHVMYLVGLIVSFCFSAIYAWLIHPKSIRHALLYGFIFGLAAGTSMGYGSYSSMPIPYGLALAWFLGVTVESILGGLLLGLMVRPPVETE